MSQEKMQFFERDSGALPLYEQSSGIDVATEPYAIRWTHPILISKQGEIDEELMRWITAAADFSIGKH